jgi:hypothetical protein
MDHVREEVRCDSVKNQVTPISLFGEFPKGRIGWVIEQVFAPKFTGKSSGTPAPNFARFNHAR